MTSVRTVSTRLLGLPQGNTEYRCHSESNFFLGVGLPAWRCECSPQADSGAERTIDPATFAGTRKGESFIRGITYPGGDPYPLPDTERCDTDARLLFTDPAFRELCLDWRTNARTCVAHLRLEAANRPGDPGLAALVGELSVADADFRQWWAGRQMTGLRMGTKRLRHPVVRDLTLDRDSLTYTAAPAQKLVTATAAPETPSRDGLLFLASWTADSDQPARDAAA